MKINKKKIEKNTSYLFIFYWEINTTLSIFVIKKTIFIAGRPVVYRFKLIILEKKKSKRDLLFIDSNESFKKKINPGNWYFIPLIHY